MIKGLVTIGTTTFDSLIKVLDKPSEKVSMKFQIAGGIYKPVNHDYEKFIPDIQSHYSEFDFIVTHAGAGSVYTLLESPMKFAVVANVERSDDHQLELARFVGSNNYAQTYTVDELQALSLLQIYETIIGKDCVKYKKEVFFKGKEIIDYIQGNGGGIS